MNCRARGHGAWWGQPFLLTMFLYYGRFTLHFTLYKAVHKKYIPGREKGANSLCSQLDMSKKFMLCKVREIRGHI